MILATEIYQVLCFPYGFHKFPVTCRMVGGHEFHLFFEIEWFSMGFVIFSKDFRSRLALVPQILSVIFVL